MYVNHRRHDPFSDEEKFANSLSYDLTQKRGQSSNYVSCQWTNYVSFQKVDHLRFLTVDHLRFFTVDHLRCLAVDQLRYIISGFIGPDPKH